MKVSTRFTFDKIRHDQDNDIHLVLDLVAPKVGVARPSVCVIPVVDCSGSMLGEKLHYAKQSLLKLVEHLTSDDYLGLVSFDNTARVDASANKMTSENKDVLRGLIGGYVARGGTNLSGGLALAMEMVSGLDLGESTLVRIILFTDGQPTYGVTSKEGLCSLVEKVGRASVSAFGYGPDACQDLLLDLSVKGNGNYSFIRDPDSALSAFGRELGGLLSTYGQDLVIEVQPHNGHLVSEVLSDFDVESEVDSQVRVKVPNILAEETLNVVFSVKMASQKSAGPRQVNAFDVKVTYKVLDDGKLVERTSESKAKIQFVKQGDEQGTPTKAVDEIVARAQLVKAQIAAEEAAKKGNFAAASSVLRDFSVSASSRGLSGCVAVSNTMGSLYSSSSAYVQASGRRQSLRKSVTRGTSGASEEDMVLLSDAGLVNSTEAQTQMEGAFKAPVTPVTPVGTSLSVAVVPFDPSLSAGSVVSSLSDSGALPGLKKTRSSRW